MEINYEVTVKKCYKNLTIDELSTTLEESRKNQYVISSEIDQCYDTDENGARSYNGHFDLYQYVTCVSKNLDTALEIAKNINQEKSN